MLEAKPLTFLWKHWHCLKWGKTSLAVCRHQVPLHTIFLLKDFWQTEQSQLISTPQEQNVDWERGSMWSIYIGFQAIKLYCFLPAPPPPTATTTFLLFSLLHHHRHISIDFPPPPPPPAPSHFHCSLPPPAPPPYFYCFPSTTTTTSFLLFSLHEIL